jgi:hypothetical protein
MERRRIKTLLRLLAASYLLGVTTMEVLNLTTQSDTLNATLWIVCLPTSAITGPVSVVVVALGSALLGKAEWIVEIAWWALVATVQIALVTAALNVGATIVRHRRPGSQP